MNYKIRIEQEVVDVTEEVYYAYYRMANREDYLVRRDREKGVYSYHAWGTQEWNGEEILRDEGADVLEILTKQEERETLYQALCQLKEKDRQLIEELYFNERTERELAEMLGVRQPAVHKRKVRILESLKKYLEKITN